jgi:hypothetical protein
LAAGRAKADAGGCGDAWRRKQPRACIDIDVCMNAKQAQLSTALLLCVG